MTRGSILFILLALCGLAGIAMGATVTQSFTYQGTLTNAGGTPLNGNYQVTFSLYEAASGGSALASYGPTSVTVTKGQFTTPVTFDTSFFDGRALWLGIKVGADPEMTPRQEIRPVPYALSLRPGAKILQDLTGYLLTIRNTGSGLNKNGLDVETVGSNSPAVYARATGPGSNAVVGETTADGPAAVAGVSSGRGSPGVYGRTTNSSAHGVYGTTSGSSSYGVYGESAQDFGVYGKGKQGGYFTTNQAGSAWPGWLPGLNVSTSYNYNPGVQIKTRGETSDGLHIETSGPYSFGLYAESAQDVGVYGVGKVGGSFTTKTAGAPDNLLAGVDVETEYNYNPGVKSLTYGTGSNAIYAESSSANTPAIYATSKGQNSPAVRAVTDCPGCNAVYGSTTADGPAAIAGSTSGVGSHGMYSITSGPWSHGFYASTSNQASDGFFGETTGPGSYGALMVTHGDNSRGVYSETSGQNADAFVGFADGVNSNGVYVYSALGNGIYAEAGPSGGYAALLKGNVNILSKSTGGSVLELGEGLDYSEGFDISGEAVIAPGTVLVISPDDPGTLTVSSEPYDRKVAGIVAGANGLGSAVKVGGDRFDANVALAGRVYCNVDATYGAVQPGDMLTTSDTPGYAMVVQDYPKAQGATLGKAMEGLDQGQKGQILVLVTLQ